ncbi:MAG: NAD(P)/FAD-dependent oxidoreductase [Candidatus Micrarchaeia archaeon]
MFDAHIIGGGPAGLFAGISACQQGGKVLLSEEHKKIGEPEACSGLISLSGLESLGSYVDYKKAAINEITSAKIICSGHEFTITPKKEKAILVSRAKFDSLAAERFIGEGGALELGKRVTRNFQSKTVIGADGPASSVADFFGFPKIRHFIHAMQGDFPYSCEDSHQAQIFVSSSEFPGFFGWAIPKNESEAEIGIGVSQQHHPLHYYRNFLAKLGVRSKPSREFAAAIPSEARRKTAMKNFRGNFSALESAHAVSNTMEKGGISVLLSGDSAGQVKATTGGGVFFGSQCGILAGKYSSSPEKYEREWRARFGLDLALHSHFRALLNMNGGQPPKPALLLAKALFFEDLLSNEGKMDQWGSMLSPSIISSYASIVASKFKGGKR